MSKASDAVKAAQASSGPATEPTHTRAAASAATVREAPKVKPGDVVVFYVYSEHIGENDETRLAESPVFALKGKKYTDANGKEHWGEVGAISVQCSNGIIRTNKQVEIDLLDSWNEDHPESNYRISRIPPEKKDAGVQIETVTVNKKVLPESVAKVLGVTDLQKVLAEDFNHPTAFDTVDEIIAEAKEAGVIV